MYLKIYLHFISFLDTEMTLVDKCFIVQEPVYPAKLISWLLVTWSPMAQSLRRHLIIYFINKINFILIEVSIKLKLQEKKTGVSINKSSWLGAKNHQAVACTNDEPLHDTYVRLQGSLLLTWDGNFHPFMMNNHILSILGVELLIHSQTSTVQSLKFGKG